MKYFKKHFLFLKSYISNILILTLRNHWSTQSQLIWVNSLVVFQTGLSIKTFQLPTDKSKCFSIY